MIYHISLLCLASSIVVGTAVQVRQWQHRFAQTTAWHRALVILERDLQQGSATWKNKILIIKSGATVLRWYFHAHGIYRHDGISRHGICLMTAVQDLQMQNNILHITTHNQKFVWRLPNVRVS